MKQILISLQIIVRIRETTTLSHIITYVYTSSFLPDS